MRDSLSARRLWDARAWKYVLPDAIVQQMIISRHKRNRGLSFSKQSFIIARRGAWTFYRTTSLLATWMGGWAYTFIIAITLADDGLHQIWLEIVWNLLNKAV